MVWIVANAALVAGLLIGLTGIGGVLVVPALTEAAGFPLERAVAASMLGFLFTGLVGTFLHLRRSQAEARELLALCLPAAAGAFGGAAMLDALPSTAIRLFIAVLALVSGVQALAGGHAHGTKSPRAVVLASLGLAVGWGSAISGTGGPVMLIPLLLLLRTPLVLAVALAQAIQVPIAFAATVVNAAAGRIDWRFGLTIGALLVGGTLAGGWFAKRPAGRGLTIAVSLALIAIGLWYGYTTWAASG
ncbi:MAG: sulfite exporter TauE/SafE family protein [Vicinamibacterales bacterium]